MKKSQWDIHDIPGQNGKVVIVTGSSSGIGMEAARVLALKNAEVVIAVRDMEKGDRALEKIKAEKRDACLTVMKLDLADLGSVGKFVKEFRNRYKKLDILINNAGVMIPPYSRTADGFELQFGTNHLGHFALTGLLIDLITGTENSRIVNVSSAAHHAGHLHFDDLNWNTRRYRAWRAYGDSKIANLYFTAELSRRLKEKESRTLSVSAHPGWTVTDLQRHSVTTHFLNRFFAQGIEMGALPTLYAAVGDGAENGDFFGPSGFMGIRGYPRKVIPNKRARDREIAGKLWDISEKLTGVSFTI